MIWPIYVLYYNYNRYKSWAGEQGEMCKRTTQQSPYLHAGHPKCMSKKLIIKKPRYGVEPEPIAGAEPTRSLHCSGSR